VDQLVAQITQDGYQKFARRKVETAYQACLKANDIGMIYGSKLQGGGRTDQTPRKPSSHVEIGDVFIIHHRRLPVLIEVWDLALRHLLIHLGRGRSRES
jgi:hypothetical protein